ncbi:uncharacterized protein K441DRAFT_682425 [Cenococcum geophilum 1.58]|uniref:Uncharacterized protein n=1 Tax=Cenococcum geophilum 1.58 TaxID=794803 RepID=A0ACC8EN20_9PEZI|nr:hypothetical protein K441DRAFT_682425 [Cenococcum geophilum 1.58]
MSYANHQLDLEEEAEQSQAIQGKGIASCGQRRRRGSSSSPTPQAGSNKRARVDEESYRVVSRVRFDEVQEHRAEADYRVNLEYERSIQWYVPGKYAASPGNELLDTSGNSLTPQEFYGDELPVQEHIAESDGDENWFGAVEDSKEPDSGQESIKKMVSAPDDKDVTTYISAGISLGILQSLQTLQIGTRRTLTEVIRAKLTRGIPQGKLIGELDVKVMPH